MEIAIIVLVIVALWVLGSLVPAGHTVPQEIAALKRPQRLRLPCTKEDLKVLCRIWANWRIERLTSQPDALIQRFEVLKGTAPYYQTRKMP